MPRPPPIVRTVGGGLLLPCQTARSSVVSPTGWPTPALTGIFRALTNRGRNRRAARQAGAGTGGDLYVPARAGRRWHVPHLPRFGAVAQSPARREGARAGAAPRHFLRALPSESAARGPAPASPFRPGSERGRG